MCSINSLAQTVQLFMNNNGLTCMETCHSSKQRHPSLPTILDAIAEGRGRGQSREKGGGVCAHERGGVGDNKRSGQTRRKRKKKKCVILWWRLSTGALQGSIDSTLYRLAWTEAEALEGSKEAEALISTEIWKVELWQDQRWVDAVSRHCRWETDKMLPWHTKSKKILTQTT